MADVNEESAVTDIINNQQAFATDVITQANAFMDQVTNLSTTQFNVDTDINPLDYQWDRAVQDFINVVENNKPERPTYSFSVNIAPTPPEIVTRNITDVSVPEFNKTAPDINIPLPPDASLPSAPTTPTYNQPDIPEAPVLLFPSAPSFSPVVLPDAPSIAIPSFTATLPVDDLVAPTTTFSFYEQAYVSALLDATKAKLLFDMENGGYGIEPTDETSLWERARSREYDASNVQMNEIMNIGAARGFRIPPGDMNVALQIAKQALLDKVSSINRDIALKRSDLYVDNRKFTITESRNLETMLINYHNSVMERSLNAAKAMLDAEIALFDALVRRYNAKLDAYRTEAQVFESKVRAALAQVEIYKTTMEGKRIELESQKVQVDVYRAQLSGIEALVNIYRTRMEATNVAANIEKVKLEAFRAQIDAYVQQVQAKVAEFNMFEARIKGETAKLQAFDSEVRAYSSLVDAAKVKATIQVENVRAEVDQAQAKIAVYNTEMEQFKAILQGDLALLSSNVQRYNADISAFAALIDGYKASYNLQLEDVKRQDSINTDKVRANIEVAKFSLEQLVESARLRNSASQYGADFYKTMIASSLSSINALAVQTQDV